MMRISDRSWLLWGIFLFAVIIIFAADSGAQNGVTIYFGNVDGTPLHVPFQGITDIPVWITGPDLGAGRIELLTDNEYISERLGGHFYYDTVFQFLDPEYFESYSSQTLLFGSVPRQVIPYLLADFTVRMDVDSSLIHDIVDALMAGTLIFADPAGYTILPTTSYASQLVIDGVSRAEGFGDNPVVFALHPAYPNPFNASTTIRFDLAAGDDASLSVYDISGRRVRVFDIRNLSPGENYVVWNGADDKDIPVASGIYFYRIVCGDNAATSRVTLLK